MTIASVLTALRRRMNNGAQFLALNLPFQPTGRLICERLRAAGAVSPERAQRFHPRNGREEWAFRAMLERGVIRQARPAHYYVVVERLGPPLQP